jgi:GNAT superfamily N-acetyltransferase
MENLIFRVGDIDDIPIVIDFCNRNGFTPRTVQDWLGGNIQAALVLNDDKLIGAMPFFRRKMYNGSNQETECAHFTAVAIDENWRSKGLGSTLLKFLVSSFDLDGLYVNSSEEDLAYKWYQRNGFEKLFDVSYYKLAINDNFIRNDNLSVQKLDGEMLSNHLCSKLVKAFLKCNTGYGGFEMRDCKFWQNKIKYHYYRLHNQYYLITEMAGISSYIITSVNSNPGREKSIDVLEFAYENDLILGSLLGGARELGLFFGIDKLRFPVKIASSTAAFLEQNGFLLDGRFSILYYSITSHKKNTLQYRYFHFDYA